LKPQLAVRKTVHVSLHEVCTSLLGECWTLSSERLVLVRSNEIRIRAVRRRRTGSGVG